MLPTEQTHEHTDSDHGLAVQLAPRPAAGVGNIDVVADCAQHSELGRSSHGVGLRLSRGKTAKLCQSKWLDARVQRQHECCRDMNLIKWFETHVQHIIK